MINDPDILPDAAAATRPTISTAPRTVVPQADRNTQDARPTIGERRKLRVNGIAMNVLLAGNGPDVLLVHGFPDTHEVWRLQIPMLVEAGYRVIVPDMRGCGETEMMSKVSDYRVEYLVDDLTSLLDLLGVVKVRLVGHDWGAVTAWQLAIRHPERVERLIALSVGHPAAYAGHDWEQRLRGWYTLFVQIRGISEALLRCGNWRGFRMLVRYDEEMPNWRRNLSRPGRLTAALSYYRGNVHLLIGARRLQQPVDVPVHAIWSSRDIFLTEKQMRASERFVRGRWTYTRIEGANHWMQLNAPTQLNPLLLDLLRS